MRIRTKNREILLTKKTLIMGVLNVTPDSFSDGGLYFNNPQKAIDQAIRMHIHGADIIDVGGESVRMGSVRVPSREEIRRIIPVISGIKEAIGDKVTISIDTYKAEVAEKAIAEGADIVNDVSGFQMDLKMPEVVAKTRAAIVITDMHSRLLKKQKSSSVEPIQETKFFFEKQLSLLKKYNISDEQVILDPGFGFYKSMADNFALIKHLYEFKTFKLPIMIAVSRKGSLGKILQKEFASIMEYGVDERLEASLAATGIGVFHGASIVRTHDVFETKNFLTVLDALKS